MKGKYAARAANRVAAAEQESTEAAYRRRVLKLTEERDTARAELAAAKSEWAKEVRILRAQLAEGTSPRVEALGHELNRMREERDLLARWKRESGQKYGAVYGRIVDHFTTEHGMNRLDACDAVVLIFEGGGARTVVVDTGVEKKFAERFGADAALALRRARGNGTSVSKGDSVLIERSS